MQLVGDERLDFLLAEDLAIIQSPSVFSFSLDAVLLARFVHVPIQKGSLIDLCSGNGVIPLLLSTRTKGKIVGVEIQERLHDMAIRSIAHNGLEGQLSMIHDDLNKVVPNLGAARHDVVTCNPPYFLTSSMEEKNVNEHFAIARHEIMCTLEDTIKASSQLLKQGGKAAFVHRPGRLLDLVTLMRKYRLEPKRIRFIYPNNGKEANTILIEGIKDGRSDVKILPPLYVHEENGEYTSEIKEILYGDRA
ncbi:tRNA1(Val) (adenine(37)-N6)-methyltransferase [Jeotgalibacillus marinus]|uniref:tRNA1(Val) (Adenine(37)-N6)-methyltransferase n=1 Tax=Jeotgalibacillus marinus TaxID=86667 RepID=A0ABV3Q9A2_9BACL